MDGIFTAVTVPWSPPAHPPSIENVPEKESPPICPASFITCLLVEVEVNVMLLLASLPANPTVVSGSKQSEPTTCMVPLTSLRDWLKLPAIDNGFMAAVEAVVNCQFPVTSKKTSCGVGEVVCPDPPPHPENARAETRHRALVKRYFMKRVKSPFAFHR